MAKKKPASVPQPANLIRDRVKELRRVKASDLLVNPKNWRTHDETQLNAIGSMLNQIGYAGAALVRETADGLMLIDGHARTERSGDSVVPVLILDVTEAESEALLASYDTIGGMAGTDAAKLNALLANVEIQDAGLAALLGGMAYVPDIDKDQHDATEILEEQSEALRSFIERRKQSKIRGADKAEQAFYVCLVFQSHKQKQEFLAQIADVPVLYGMYADGQTLATRIGMPVTPNEQRPIHSPLDKKLKAMAMLPPEDLT